MTLENIYYIGQTIAVVAILASLVFVALQMRASTQARKLESLNVALGVHAQKIALLTGDDARAELFRKFALNFDELSLNERGRIHALLWERSASFNQIVYLHSKGLVSDEEFLQQQATFVSILRTPGGRRWWRIFQIQAPPKYSAYMSKALDDPAITRKAMHEVNPWLFGLDNDPSVGEALANAEPGLEGKTKTL